jgi:hypothetical protein
MTENMEPSKYYTKTDYILHIIDSLLNASQHNTLLLWQGVNRSWIFFGAAVAICTFLFNISSSLTGHIPLITQVVCAIIAALSMIGNRLIIISITRNSEHVYKYNKAIEKLEELLSVEAKKSTWVQYLPISVYKNTLKGSNTAKHNKQIARAFPWAFWFLSSVGIIGCVTWIIKDYMKGSTVCCYVCAVLIGFAAFFTVEYGLRPLLQFVLKLSYKNETEKWDEELEKMEQVTKTAKSNNETTN